MGVGRTKKQFNVGGGGGACGLDYFAGCLACCLNAWQCVVVLGNSGVFPLYLEGIFYYSIDRVVLFMSSYWVWLHADGAVAYFVPGSEMGAGWMCC